MIEAGPQKGLSLSSPFSLDKRTKMKVELDRKALFALASDSRMEILKELQSSRRTVTQLAEAVDIDKAAVHRHLKKLEEGGLVTRYEDHGFVYYGLSWKARDLIAPGENTRIVITFALSIVMAVGAIGAVFLSISPATQRYGEATQTDPMAGANSTNFLVSGGESWEWILLAIVLGSLAIVLAYLAMKWIRKPKQALESSTNDPAPPSN